MVGPRSLHSRQVLAAALVTALGAGVLTVLVQVVLARSTNDSLDTVLVDRAAAVIGSATVGPEGLGVPDDRLDAGVAVYDDAGVLVAGAAPSAETSLYDELSGATARRIVAGDGADESRVLAEPFDVEGRRGVVVATERLAPYERSEAQALYLCLGAGLLMVGLAAGLASWSSRRALAPVAAMTVAADDWSEHDLQRRFAPGPGRDEIAALGRTFDRLLDRVSSALLAEQRLTSELAHELRTPLAAVQANAELALLEPGLADDVRAGLDEVLVATRRMSTTIESLLDLARAPDRAGAGSCVLRHAVDEAVGVRDVDRDGEVDVVVELDDDLRVRSPHALAVRALAPVLDNARRHADHVVVGATERGGLVEVSVDDDGPGIAGPDRELVFEPGRTTSGGAGLGLALARRVARSLGGDVVVTDGPLSTRVVVSLPAAGAPDEERRR